MIFTFAKTISPYVQAEFELARQADANNQPQQAFIHLQNAHVLGQNSTYLHVKAHWLMLLWGVRQFQIKEVLGQLLRIIGAATKTAIGWVPSGNTGGANISPFKSLPLTTEHAQLIKLAQQAARRE
ncbi:DUF3703 domain-containing protein [Alteromonadaceae bacterium BrNp21-10]|nr:DUF3703 domain-containing protein [Alteromonadaceae bacterium BrNp21-10]